MNGMRLNMAVINEWRKTHNNMSLSNLAERVGVSRASFYCWKKGTRKPCVAALIKIYNETGIPIEQLIKEK